MTEKDWSLFNCLQQQEHDYVVKHYSLDHRPRVKAFLRESCLSGRIANSTHQEIHELILNQLGYQRLA